MDRLIVYFLIMLFITGCALAPGLHLQEDQFAVVESSDAESLPIPLYRITPETVRSLYMKESSEHDETGMPDISRKNQISTVYGQHKYRYRVGPQDVLSVIVWDHPELTIPAGGQRSAEIDGHRVSADGTIFYPYVGTVFVAGKTVDEIRNILTKRLSRYIKNPQLGVTVVSFGSKKIYVMGDVARSSAVPITNMPLYLAEVLSNAGVDQTSADPERVFVLRLEEDKPVAYHLDASEPGSLILATAFQMKPQDVVFVSSADIARWGQTLRQILPSLNTIWLIDANN